MKTCSQCKLRKSLDDFYSNKCQADKKSHRCKECCKEDQKRIYRNNPEKQRTRRANYLSRYSEKYNASRRASRRQNHITECSRKYGASKELLSELLKSKVCQICGESMSFQESNIHRRPNVDHCHSTGQVRGVICGYCNNLLGRARDSVAILEKAINYLNGKCGTI